MTLRVLLDTSYALRGPSGTATYLAGLVPALRAAGVDVVEAADTERGAPGGGGPRSAANLARDLRWTQVELPRRAAAVHADVLHHPLPALSRRAPCPQVVTVHDLAFERLPEAFDPAFRAWARRTHRAAARGADAVLCPSEGTARDVQGRWGVPAQRVHTALHGPGAPLPPPQRPAAPQHFLSVGDAEPRKNLDTLLAAYARHRETADQQLPLVLAGRGLPTTLALAAGPGVRVEPTPPPDRLAALYAQAAALVHPSMHEGFGLTVLEAMAAGTPVVAGRVPGVTEVAGDAALFVDPRDPSALAQALTRIAADGALRDSLSAKGRTRSEAFTWERCAARHLVAYERVAAHTLAGR